MSSNQCGTYRKCALHILMLCILLSACTGIPVTSQDAADRPAILGTLKLWPDGTPVAERRVVPCKVNDESSLPECELMESPVITGADGSFVIDRLEPGNYFLLYESGEGDFTSAMETWGGRKLSWLEKDWIIEWLNTIGWYGGSMDYTLPQGTTVEGDFLPGYVAFFLLQSGSPFYVAFDVDKAAHAYFNAHSIARVDQAGVGAEPMDIWAIR
jgi:hypothetical protein